MTEIELEIIEQLIEAAKHAGEDATPAIERGRILLDFYRLPMIKQNGSGQEA